MILFFLLKIYNIIFLSWWYIFFPLIIGLIEFLRFLINLQMPKVKLNKFTDEFDDELHLSPQKIKKKPSAPISDNKQKKPQRGGKNMAD